MLFKATLFLALTAVALAIEYGHNGGHGGHHYDEHAEPHYSYHYSVKDDHTKDIKSAWEERKGDHTQGEYSLIEPDGTHRIVKYQVKGHSGFLAEVKRDGHSVHAPSHNKPVHHAQPIYHAQASYHAQPAYHSQGSYHAQPAHNAGHSYSGGHATSSASISTHGAHISTHTNHHQPAKAHGYY